MDWIGCGSAFTHKALFTKKMVETQNTTMLNKEIKYNSLPTSSSWIGLDWVIRLVDWI